MPIISDDWLRTLFLKTTFPLAKEHEKEPLSPPGAPDPSM